jgi:hypothetical protein
VGRPRLLLDAPHAHRSTLSVLPACLSARAQLNVANPATGQQKMVDLEDEKKT